MKIRTYTELKSLKTFEERFKYLQLRGQLGVATFGFDRWLNQNFYKSREWRLVREKIILRDESCDLGIRDRSIFTNVRIHHMNPMTVEDVKDDWSILLDPEFLICTSLETHNAIHFGDEKNLVRLPKERLKNDTKLW